MELFPTAISAGYAAGLNAYGTVLMLGLLGRAGFGEVPDELDTTWDILHTAIRPAIGSVIGVEFADLDRVTGAETVAAGGLGGSTALVSHGLKAGLRLGINTSPEPVSNIIVSLTEDGIVAAVVGLGLQG